MRVFVVLNPVAGRTQATDLRKVLDRHFRKPSWQLDVYETTGQENVAELVGDAVRDGVNMVFAAGGDGTVSAVVDGLATTGIPLGIIPAGTSNVIAQELGLPLTVDKACRLLAISEKTRAIDALQLGDRYFILSVGTGIDALAMEGTTRESKRRFGPLAYIWSAWKAILGVQPHIFTIIADGQRKRVRAAGVLLTNVSTLTRPFRWGAHIRPDDGTIDILIMRAHNLFDFVGVAWDILVPGRPRRNRNLRYWHAKHSVIIFSEKPIPVQGDGDLLGKTPIEIQIWPGAVQVLVPENEERNRWRPLSILKNGK